MFERLYLEVLQNFQTYSVELVFLILKQDVDSLNDFNLREFQSKREAEAYTFRHAFITVKQRRKTTFQFLTYNNIKYC